MTLNLERATEQDLAEIRNLLQAADLPAEDVTLMAYAFRLFN
jgi:hypothetical protein